MEIYFLMILEARSVRSRCYCGWFPVGALSLACKWPPAHCVLTWHLLGAERERETERQRERDWEGEGERERQRERDWEMERERDVCVWRYVFIRQRKVYVSSFHKGTRSIKIRPTPITLLNFYYLLKAFSLNAVTLRLRT